MLALALAESAQQVSIQSQSRSSEPPTPVSPSQSQDCNLQDPHPLVPHFQTSCREKLEQGSSQPPKSTAPTVTAASSCPTASSPPVKPQPLETETTSTVTKSPDSPVSSQSPPGTQLHADSTLSDTSIQKCTPASCSVNLPSPTRKSPERQQPIAGHIPVPVSVPVSVPGPVPVHTSSSSSTPATTPSGSCKDTGVLPQSVPEVSVLSCHFHHVDWCRYFISRVTWVSVTVFSSLGSMLVYSVAKNKMTSSTPPSNNWFITLWNYHHNHGPLP